MISPVFLSELPSEQLKKLSEEDIEKIQKAERLYWESKPYTKFYVAVNGAKTKKGGLICATGLNFQLHGIAIALVGDEAIYHDGTTAKIISGSGDALTIKGSSVALVGSRLDNGDEVIDSPDMSLIFRLYHDMLPPMGFLNY